MFMKKLSAVCLVACILMSLCLACLPVAAAEDKYAAAKDGDLVYTVDFYGDEFYKPEKTYGDPTVEVDAVDHGKATIYTKTNKSKSRWGAEITCLPLGENNAYTMYYTVTRDTVDSALGVFVDDQYGIYGYSYNQRLLSGTSTLAGHNTIVYADAGVNLDSNVNTNGGTFPSVQEFALEFNGQRCTMKAYIKDSGGNWVLIDETADTEIIIFYTEHVGLFLYTYWENQPVTISDVNIYKGMLVSGEKLEAVDTKPVETTTEKPDDTTTPKSDETTTPKADDTTTPEPAGTTTPKPTEANTTAPEKTGGCGSVVALGVTACLLPAAAVLRRKKK